LYILVNLYMCVYVYICWSTNGTRMGKHKYMYFANEARVCVGSTVD